MIKELSKHEYGKPKSIVEVVGRTDGFIEARKLAEVKARPEDLKK